MSAVFDHPMPPEEIEALIKSLALEADNIHVRIVEEYGSVQDAVVSKRNGDKLAGNLLRERNKIMKEKRGWEKDLAAMKRKGSF